MNIITGYRGEPHITSSQDRAKNQGTFGTGSYILDVGQKLNAEIISASEIRIRDGLLSHQGCIANIDQGAYDSLEISNGSQGMLRQDLIVARYTKDAETNIEDISLVVIEGTPASSNPTDPAYNTGNIQSGDSPVDMPLYRVNINGTTISGTTRLPSVVHTISLLSSNAINNYVNNANNATETDILYGANENTLNTPRAAYWTLWVKKYSNTHMTQYALLVNATYTLLYARSMGGGIWGGWSKVEDTRTVSLTNGVVTTATPSIRHKNGIITIEFALQIPARAYTSSNALWTINRPPSGTIHFITFVGPSPTVFRLTNSGEIVFNSDTTLSSTTWMIGHVTYPSD